MGTIIISTNMSLDGIVQDPDGQEGFAHGGWWVESGGADLGAWREVETQETLAASALLLGRRSDAWFAERWRSRDGEWADALNAMPKYVVSSTVTESQWANGTVLAGDVVEDVARLKQTVEGEILLYASYELGQLLLEHDLVDELRLFVFPVIVGSGNRLFGPTTRTKPMRLLSTESVGAGLSYLRYAVADA